MTEAEKPRAKSSRFRMTIAIGAVVLIAILILLGPRLVPLARWFVDFVLHLDKHLGDMIQRFGFWIYLILATIVFCETGLVVTPVLPGDSLLFAAGGFAATGDLNLAVLLTSLAAAAILGDSVNYSIGRYIGTSVYTANSRWIKREHLERTHAFFERYGGKTIVIAQFAPFLRTFAPFVAGVGRMSYSFFAFYNILGVLLWVATFVLGGYYFGQVPFVKKHFTVFILAIIFVSLIPAVVEFLRARKAHPAKKP